MIFIAENLKKFRKDKDLTQEEVANLLLVTPQSVSKWERGDSYPDITFLPALANLFETSVDALIGMDTIRAYETRDQIHQRANEHMMAKEYRAAADLLEDALHTFPTDAGMMLHMAHALALLGESDRAISLYESSLMINVNDNSRVTARAALCFLYLKTGEPDKANAHARALPHTRESREVIQPIITMEPDAIDIDMNLRNIILGIC